MNFTNNAPKALPNWVFITNFAKSENNEVIKLQPKFVENKGGNFFCSMIQNFLLSDTLTDFQLKLLDLIQHLHQKAEKANSISSRNKEPIITLQYANIVSLFRCSPCTIKLALDRLYALRLIDEVEKNYNECATYRYNPSVYRSLVRKAKARKCILYSGRPKKGTPRQAREVDAETVLKYMTGKAIIKAAKRK